MRDKQSKIPFGDRMYWFRRNTSAVLLGLIALPIKFIYDYITLFKFLFITNGSCILDYPWNWDWK
jgi:hypothetical protein